MSDDGKHSKGGIPSWQRAGQAEASRTKPESTESSEAKTTTVAHDQSQQQQNQDQDPAKLLARAQSFLQDESVRDSPLAEKVAFLKAKGVSQDDIDRALGTTTTPASGIVATDQIPSATQSQIKSLVSRSATTTAATSSPAPALPPKRDVPPIITYPEFLVQSNARPPIITGRRLATTAYVAAGASALVYGASKYLVTPMAESLNAARHDFAQNAHAQLGRLNSLLESIVSTDPAGAHLLLKAQAKQDEEDAASNGGSEDSDDSDPTELFHRDFGTQTVDLPSSSSSDASSATEAGGAAASETAVDAHTRQLRRLKQLCDDIATEERSETDTTQEVAATLKVIDEQLSSLSVPLHGLGAFGGGFGTGGFEGLSAASAERKNGAGGDNDELGRAKAEIRSIKGSLLSARLFPGGGGGGGSGVRSQSPRAA